MRAESPGCPRDDRGASPMECQGCGHNYPSTLSCCPKCKRLSPKRGQRFSNSRLIEFPRRARVQPKAEPVEAQLPAWRTELNERVRAIKARRDGQSSEGQLLNTNPPQNSYIESRDEFPATRHSEPRPSSRVSVARDERIFSQEPHRSVIPQPAGSREQASTARLEHKTKSHIVEAALTRVRRASENASRATLPKIEPARQAQPTPRNSFTIDREATARALEPAAETTSRAAIATSPAPDLIRQEAFEPEIDDGVVTKAVKIEAKPLPEMTVIEEPPFSNCTEEFDATSVAVLDEIEPVDYLEAEIRKVSADWERESGLPLSTHFAIGLIDLFSIAISASPFVALIIISNGSFEATQTRLAAAAAVALVGFFYLAVTQWLAGKTFGMMLTNTHVVDAETLEPVSPSRALVRTAGYLIAAAPALLGFLWIAVSRKRRGWHDYLSGTMVASDY
jgi:uncharacterized RDD family membrane protein YckC